MRNILIGLFLVIFTGTCMAGGIKGKVSTAKIKSPSGILVYIEKIDGKEFPPPAEHLVMDQVKLVFIPRVLPVLKGAAVDFVNSDDVKHNVFGVGSDDFDLGTWTKGIVKSYTFNKLGDVAILCNVHPEMEAFVVVLQNPYFGLTDAGGNYEIKDVPPGKYKLKTWHDRLKPATKDVEVAGDTVEVGFEI